MKLGNSVEMAQPRARCQYCSNRMCQPYACPILPGTGRPDVVTNSNQQYVDQQGFRVRDAEPHA